MSDSKNHDKAEFEPVDFEEDAIDFEDDAIDFEDVGNDVADDAIDFDTDVIDFEGDDGIDFDDAIDDVGIEDMGSVSDPSAASDFSIDAFDETEGSFEVEDEVVELTDVVVTEDGADTTASPSAAAGFTAVSADAVLQDNSSDTGADAPIELVEVVEKRAETGRNSDVFASSAEISVSGVSESHLVKLVEKIIEEKYGNELDKLLTQALENVLNRKLELLKENIVGDVKESVGLP